MNKNTQLSRNSAGDDANKPNIFGHLYIAVFSNGTVKAGMSKSSPGDRVTTHANAGKAFGISMDSSFFASIYTSDTRAREKLMHQEISLLAAPTTGREWFKFDDVNAAVNFASSYLCKIERMSFAERPSIEELAVIGRSSLKRFEGVFPTIFSGPSQPVSLPDPASSDDLQKIETLLGEYGLNVVIGIAGAIMRLEEQEAMNCKDMNHGMPMLRDAVDAYYDDFASAVHKQMNDGAGMSAAIELERGRTLNRDEAVKIIKAAAHYPAFFFEAMKHGVSV